MVSLGVILFSTKCFLFVYMYIDLFKLKAYLKIVTLTSPGFFLAHLELMVSYWDRAVWGVRRPLSTFYLVYAIAATFSVQSSWNLVRMFVSIKSRTSSKLGHFGSKTRSLGQILEKFCVCSRCHIFSEILEKFGRNVCLDKILDKFEIWSYGVKN